MKTIVYVDGLNLYYSMLRGTPFKWLDLYSLFRDQDDSPEPSFAATTATWLGRSLLSGVAIQKWIWD